MARGKSLPVPSLGVCEPTCGSVSLLLAQPPTQEVPVPSPLHVRGSPAPVPTAAAAATGHRHRHPAGVLPAQSPRSCCGPQGCQGMSLASRGGTGSPAHTTVPPCAPCSCTAKNKSPWGPRRAGTACAQHRATAAGSLSPRRLDAGRSPQLLSHPGAGADRRGSGQTQPRCCTVSAAASSPPSLCPAHPARLRAGSTLGCQEPRKHPAAHRGAAAGSPPVLPMQPPAGSHSSGSCQPRGTPSRASGAVGRGLWPGLSGQPAPAPWELPGRAQAGGRAVPGLGFLSVSTCCRNSFPARAEGFLDKGGSTF